MKPSFALNFTENAVVLLHRTSRGWMEVGSVPLEDADFGSSLAFLRASAAALEPRGLTTKVIIPNSQIRYMTLTAPGPDSASRRAQIRAELEGRTPYAVDDLVFDWWGKGPSVQVAVVARETLDEAEAFASENRLNPLSFVGMPEPGIFGAEPWFGPTGLAATLLSPGEKVDRDQDPVQIVGRLPRLDATEPASAAAPPAPAEEAVPAEATVAEADVPVPAEPLPEPEAAAPVAEVPPEPAPADTPVAEPDQPEEPVPTEPAESARVAEERPKGKQKTPVAASEVTATSIPEVPEAKAPPARASRITPALGSADSDTLRVVTDPRLGKPAAPPRAPAKAPARPAEPKVAAPAPAARLSAIQGGAGGTARSAKLAMPETDWPLERVTTAARQARDETLRAGSMITAPNISMPRDRKLTVVPKPEPEAEQTAARSRSRESDQMTMFGKRAAQRGKPRYLGLILTVLLLLALFAVAAWSSYFIASVFNPASTRVVETPVPAETGSETVSAALPEPVAAAVPEPAPASPAPTDPGPVTGAIAALAEPEPETDSAAEPGLAAVAAAAGPEAATPAPAAEAEPPVETAAPAPQAEPAVEPVEAASAAPPDTPDTTAQSSRNPEIEAEDKFLLARIDPKVVPDTAVALAEVAIAADPAPPSQPLPPPFGTLYRFDAEGRIVPTPEGIVTPEGVLLIAGRPARVPPPRPEALAAAPAPAQEDVAQPETAAAAPAAAATPEVAAAEPPAIYSDPALADARPRVRPEGLAPQVATTDDDGAALDVIEVTRESSPAPRARPAAILAAGEAALQAETAAVQAASASLLASAEPGAEGSPLAIAVSRKPAPRPAQTNAAIEAAVTVAAAEASLVPESAPLIPDAPAVAAKPPEIDDPAAVEIDEPEVTKAAPSIPKNSSVAKQATYKNAINLSKVSLIGVYGTSSKRYAMVRQSNGRFVKVEVGDRVDGGRVAAISERELRYVKNGTSHTLSMPKG